MINRETYLRKVWHLKNRLSIQREDIEQMRVLINLLQKELIKMEKELKKYRDFFYSFDCLKYHITGVYINDGKKAKKKQK